MLLFQTCLRKLIHAIRRLVELMQYVTTASAHACPSIKETPTSVVDLNVFLVRTAR